jgi:hypothetical protein
VDPVGPVGGYVGGRLVQYAGGRPWWVGVVGRHWQTPSFGTVRGGVEWVLCWGPPRVLVMSLSALVRWWGRL